MKIKCDICGKETYALSNILSIYCTKNVDHVCYDCGEDLNNALDKIKSITSKLNQKMLKRYIRTQKKLRKDSNNE